MASSLGALAKSHLDDVDDEIPDLFGDEDDGQGIEESVTNAEIDLMKALRLTESEEDGAKREIVKTSSTNLPPRGFKFDVDAIFADVGLKAPSASSCTPCSAFGSVLCRRWSTKKPPEAPYLTPTKAPFDFSTPSPDDIVLNAQSKVYKST